MLLLFVFSLLLLKSQASHAQDPAGKDASKPEVHRLDEVAQSAPENHKMNAATEAASVPGYREYPPGEPPEGRDETLLALVRAQRKKIQLLQLKIQLLEDELKRHK